MTYSFLYCWCLSLLETSMMIADSKYKKLLSTTLNDYTKELIEVVFGLLASKVTMDQTVPPKYLHLALFELMPFLINLVNTDAIHAPLLHIKAYFLYSFLTEFFTLIFCVFGSLCS